MSIEAIVFFAGATGLLALAGLIGYAIGYSACQRAWIAADTTHRYAWEAQQAEANAAFAYQDRLDAQTRPSSH